VVYISHDYVRRFRSLLLSPAPTPEQTDGEHEVGEQAQGDLAPEGAADPAAAAVPAEPVGCSSSREQNR
jgi:hypothetical protein